MSKKNENKIIKGNRIEWVDAAKFICMFLIMVSHLEFRSEGLLKYYVSFYVAGFFMCSGYCYSSKSISFSAFIKKKAKTLLLPWFIYSNLNIIISNIRPIKEHNGLFIEVFRNLLQIRYFDDRLWFLVSLFVTFIPFYFLVDYIEKNKENNLRKAIFLSFVLFFIKKMYSYYVPWEIFPWGSNKLPWHIDYIPTALLSMVIGYSYKVKYENNYLLTKNNVQLSVALLYFAVCFVGGIIQTNNNFISFFLFDFVESILGIAVLIMISKKIKPNDFIRFVGQNTLLYFCLHNKVITLFEHILKSFFITFYYQICSIEFTRVIISFLITFIASIVLIIPCLFIKRYMAWTLGEENS